MAENKTKPTEVSVAAYIEAITDEIKRADAKALVKLMQKRVRRKAEDVGASRSSASAAITTSTRAGARATCR